MEVISLWTERFRGSSRRDPTTLLSLIAPRIKRLVYWDRATVRQAIPTTPQRRLKIKEEQTNDELNRGRLNDTKKRNQSHQPLNPLIPPRRNESEISTQQRAEKLDDNLRRFCTITINRSVVDRMIQHNFSLIIRSTYRCSHVERLTEKEFRIVFSGSRWIFGCNASSRCADLDRNVSCYALASSITVITLLLGDRFATCHFDFELGSSLAG